MLSQDMIEKVLDRASEKGADFAEVFEEERIQQETQITQDEIEQCQNARECGVGIRLFKDKTRYYAYTNDRSEAAVFQLVTDLTKTMKGDCMARQKLQDKKIYTMVPETVVVSDVPLKERITPARQAVAAGMAQDEIVRMRVKLTDMEQTVQIANTEGVYVQDTRVKTRLYISAYAQNGTDVQSGYYGPGAMRGHEYYNQIDVEAAAREAARAAKVILHAKPCRGGQMPAVVANGFGGLLFHEACGHSLESTVIARGSSEFCGMLGKKVASDVVTLVDDGSIAGEWGSLHVDDEGTPTQKNVLIENGILKSYMVDKLDGLRAGLKPTGSARRQDYRHYPVARMTNTYIAPGKNTPEEIITSTEKGLYVKSINGGSVDPATGDFNFNASECYMIRNGRLAEPVRGVTLIGNGGTILKAVDMVADDFDLRQGFCYASSGALYIGAGQPTIRVCNMTVGGIE